MAKRRQSPRREPDASGGRDVMLPLAHYAMLVGVVQFLPIPFVDDWIHRRLMRKVVGDILRRRGRQFAVEDLAPLFEPGGGGMLGPAGSAARALVLKPMKRLARTVLIVFGARRAALEAAQVLLIGHTLDRQLARGGLPDAATSAERGEEARRIADAVRGAWKGSDRRFLIDVIRRSGGLLVQKGAPDEPEPDVAADPQVEQLEKALLPGQRSRLKAAGAKLAGLLRSPDGQSWLTKFDAEVDRRLG